MVVGGIIPEADADALMAQGVAAVFTPKDYGLTEIMGRVVERSAPRAASPPFRAEPRAGASRGALRRRRVTSRGGG